MAGGLGALGIKIAALIGPGSMLAAAGLVGYGSGSIISTAIEGTKADDAIGYAAARVAAFFGSENAREAVRITSGGTLYADPVQPAGTKNSMINNTIVMPNGEVLAKVVTQSQAREVSRPQLGSGRFDPGLMPASPGMSLR